MTTAPYPSFEGRPANELGAAEAVREIAAGRLRAVDLLDACLAQISNWDSTIHAWVHSNAAGARVAAAAVDAALAAGQAPGTLGGVPVGLKDIFNTTEMPTQMGSPIWAGFTPGNDARVVHYLRMAGAVFPGKTVTAEFAVHAPGPTENPHRRGFMPGTSSSGSAAAVAAYMVPVALGTQTAGSIVRPASYCGVYGFKPSFGLVPRTGMLKTTDTLDTVGWFARNVEDLKLLFDTIRVKGLDFPLSEAALQDPERQSRPSTRPWRVAFVKGPKWAETAATTRERIEAFAQRLATTPEISVETVEAPAELFDVHDVHETIYNRALAYYFKEEYQQHTLVSGSIYEIVEKGQRLTPQDYQVALAQQTRIARVMDGFFADYDVVLDMTTAGEALPGLSSVDRPDHALIWTLCGLPAVSVPALTGPLGLPLGVQFVARRYNDPLLFAFLGWLEEQGVIGQRTYPEPPMAASVLAAAG